jgi:transcriptional regulator with XRE-family HTH domain
MPRHNGRDARTNPAAFLGVRLRQGRIDAGFSSQDALAAKLGFDRTVITKAETGERPPTPDVLSTWCETCDLDLDMFTGLAELARSADGPIPTWFEGWLDAEGNAHTIRIWQPLIIPGLLQTGEYARALFVAAGADEDRATDLVNARLERQAILDRSQSPHVIAVLDESVLHRLIGSAQVMADQLAHLADVAGRPNISVEIVPVSTGANAGLSGGFQLASCDGAPDVLNMNGVEDVTAESRSLVRQATVIFDLVRGDALPRTASRTLISEAAEEWKTR